MKINCIAIDDEPLALDKIRSFIKKIEYLNLTEAFDNAFDAIGYLKKNKTDLIFLDIQMDDFTGIQLMETLKKTPKVIFTTAYDAYALKGYELGVNDYLLKPYSFARFAQAVEKIYNISLKENKHSNNSDKKLDTNNLQKEYIFVKDGYKIVKISLKEILYVEGMKDYLKIKTTNSTTHTLLNFSKIEQLLVSSNFIRVHKSYIIAINKIESIEKNQILIRDNKIPIGNTYKKAFFNRIDAYNSNI